MKEYKYVNELGEPKILNVRETPNPDGKYHCILWSGRNGEHCGSSDLTYDELEEFLAHYGINL